MEIESKRIVTSEIFDTIDIPSIFYYGLETFGIKLADKFIEEIYLSVERLET